VKAFSLAIKGIHYEIVMNSIVREARVDAGRESHESPLMNARA
jgi:hypothetical protein